MKRTYDHVPVNDDEHEIAIELTGISSTSPQITIPSSNDSFEDDHQLRIPSAIQMEHSINNSWNRWEEPILPSSFITFLLVPIIFLWIGFGYHFTGRLWASWGFVLHLHLRLGVSRWHFNCITEEFDYSYLKHLRMACSFAAFMDIFMCLIAYPFIAYLLTEAFFREVDGTINLDWRSNVALLRTMASLGFIVGLLRLGVKWDPTLWNIDSISNTAQQRMHKAFVFTNIVILVLNALCILSVLSHFGPWPGIPLTPAECDPLDTTLCALPFPSFFHMRKDESTNTGWRVDLKGLPPLRGGLPLHPNFLNDLDGFSTMAPILFYMEGLKEAHEGPKFFGSKLQGPTSIEKSITNQSITILVNVDEQTLVPHSAEIDYLDTNSPLVLVIPAQPLSSSSHFALAVFNASDVNGNRLPQSEGLTSVFNASGSPTYHRYMDIVLPALRHAAPWTGFTHDPGSVQLLFDFITMSEEKQIGHTRAVRDFALNHVDKWDWQDHVELVSEVKHDCINNETFIARTYHINLDVPSFLKKRSRYSTLDSKVFLTGEPVSIERSKAMIRVPCSVENAAFGHENGKPVKVVMEYGHGLMNQRGEVQGTFLSRMANDNGYILMAMDWRGMSVFDLPVVIKTLVGNPDLFQAVRDNLIQGYSEKLVLQHFSRNGMFDWLKIDGVDIPTEYNELPASVFYGISQGGILGGGYLALAGNTTLVDRGILGSPGTPFTSVLIRSMDFILYDTLMLFNFYNNRHVRLFLSLAQMGWDSVEVSGLLAPPLNEPLPKVLIQTGLGDTMVPTGACESMARAMHARVLENNQRSIFGVPIVEEGNDPNVVLTELMYEEEYLSLPLDNTPPQRNRVHFCVRWDPAMISQVEAFANTGQVMDSCVQDQCRRPSSKEC